MLMLNAALLELALRSAQELFTSEARYEDPQTGIIGNLRVLGLGVFGGLSPKSDKLNLVRR